MTRTRTGLVQPAVAVSLLPLVTVLMGAVSACPRCGGAGSVTYRNDHGRDASCPCPDCTPCVGTWSAGSGRGWGATAPAGGLP